MGDNTMTVAKILAGTLCVLAALASRPVLAGWEVGDPKDIRIELRGLDLPGDLFRQVSFYRGSYQNTLDLEARSDLIASGDLRRAEAPYLLVFYQSSAQFGYETLEDGLASFSFLKNARLAFQSGTRTSPSRLGDVDYLLFTASDPATGLARSCAYWAGFFSGNRLVYKGLYCPAKHAATDEDARLAVNAVAVKPGR
jgi:hypothetical protein